MKQQDKLRNTLREYYDNQEVPFNDEDWRRAGAMLKTTRNNRRSGRMALLFIASLAILSGLFYALFSPKELKSNSYKNENTAASARPLENKYVSALADKTRDNNVKVRSHNLKNTVRPSANQHPNVIAQRNKGMLMENSEETKMAKSVKTTADRVPEELAVSEQTVVAIENSTQNGNTISASPANTIGVTYVDRAEPFVGDTITQPIPQYIPTANLVAPDTLQPEMLTSVEILPVTTLRNDLLREGVFLEAGANWFYGWKGPSKRDANGFSPFLGIHYMNRLSERYAFSFGLAYAVVPNLSNSSKTSRVSSYEYGGKSAVTVISPSAVHYLMTPFRFHWAVGTKNSFGAGVTISYLLNVFAKVTTYTEVPGLTSNYQTVKLGGYTQGFSQFDTQLAFCYRRRLGNCLSMQAEVFLGLTDVKQDAFWKLSQTERNSGLKLSLIYNVFKR